MPFLWWKGKQTKVQQIRDICKNSVVIIIEFIGSKTARSAMNYYMNPDYT